MQAALAERAEKMDVWTAGVLRKAIERWKKPKEFESNTEAQVRIQIDSDGELEELTWVKPTGIKSVDKSIVRAFESAAPYEPPPDAGAAFNGVVITVPASPR